MPKPEPMPIRLTEISDLTEVERQIARFRRALSSRETQERMVGNRGSTEPCLIHVHRDLGFWVVLGDAGEQTWHVFGRIDDHFEKETGTLPHVCQINFSYAGSSRVSGTFAADPRDRVFVTHSGGIGGGRSGIGKNGFLEYISEHAHLPLVDIDSQDGGRTTRLLLGELNTPSFRSRTAEFVHLVDRFKRHARADADEASATAGLIGKRGQGYERDPEVRRVVEAHAMTYVANHYRSLGYTVRPVSNRPGELDLRCTRRGTEIWVEVKGTAGEGNSVELTDAELRRSRERDVLVHLAVLSGIRVNRSECPPRASGGTLFIYKRFSPDQHTLVPTKYRCTLDHSHGEHA